MASKLVLNSSEIEEARNPSKTEAELNSKPLLIFLIENYSGLSQIKSVAFSAWIAATLLSIGTKPRCLDTIGGAYAIQGI
jgi:hypothetical protein